MKLRILITKPEVNMGSWYPRSNAVFLLWEGLKIDTVLHLEDVLRNVHK